jgi:dolichyl-phosphate-mannose-protein mannosyltransferase
MFARLLPPALIAAILLTGAALPASPRAFQVVVLAAMLAALWEAGSRLARWLAPDLPWDSHAVAAFSLAVGVAVVPATWMGQFGWLRPAPFLVWTAAAFLLSHLLPRRNGGAGLAPTPAPASKAIRVDTALLIMAALAVFLVGVNDLWRLRWAPAGPHGFDDISYHLSAVATWLRHGDVRMIRFSMGAPTTPFFPILGEMASWVLIAPFRDSDVAARWTQLFFAVFSFLAVASIARRLGLSRRNAAFAAICYAGIYHVFPVLSVSAGNDQSTSFFTLAGLDAGLALARRPRPGIAVVTGTALGLLLATKYIGVLFVPPVLAVIAAAVWMEWIERRRREPAGRPQARALLGIALALALAMAVSGGYTYLRNAVTTGNPLFPAPVKVFGFEVFPGWGGISPSDLSSAPEAQIDVWQFLTRRSKLFGSWFPFTLLPAALLAPLLALWRRRWPAALVFALSAVLFLEFLYLMADHRDIRYFLPAVALAAVAFAWLLEEIGPRAIPVRDVVLAWIAFQSSWHVGVAGLVVVAAVGVFLERGWWRGEGRIPAFLPWMRWAAAGAVLVAALPLGWAVGNYQVKKFTHPKMAAPLALDRIVGPRGARVAYAGYNQPYFFFGSRFQNDLQIVPRNRMLDAQYYQWGTEVRDPYVEGTYRRWWDSLQERGIEYVVIVRGPWEEPEGRWVSRRKEDFALAWTGEGVEIWRVLNDSQGTTGTAGTPGTTGTERAVP